MGVFNHYSGLRPERERYHSRPIYILALGASCEIGAERRRLEDEAALAKRYGQAGAGPFPSVVN